MPPRTEQLSEREGAFSHAWGIEPLAEAVARSPNSDAAWVRGVSPDRMGCVPRRDLPCRAADVDCTCRALLQTRWSCWRIEWRSRRRLRTVRCGDRLHAVVSLRPTRSPLQLLAARWTPNRHMHGAKLFCYRCWLLARFGGLHGGQVTAPAIRAPRCRGADGGCHGATNCCARCVLLDADCRCWLRDARGGPR